MARVKVEVVRCIIDGKRHGETNEVDEGVAAAGFSVIENPNLLFHADVYTP